jgi:hypothetical protein
MGRASAPDQNRARATPEARSKGGEQVREGSRTQLLALAGILTHKGQGKKGVSES